MRKPHKFGQRVTIALKTRALGCRLVPPRYSILLPTRNGLRYLPYAIESVLSQDSQDFELIVSDNHSTDGTPDYLATIADPRFRHVKPDTLLSMAAHFEWIITHAQGTWITTLGDDDGLMPFTFERLDQIDLDSTGVEAVVFRRAYYFWAGCEELYGPQVVSYEPSFTRHIVSNRWAILVCVASISDYMRFPQLYTTGFVKRAYIEAIKRKTGGRFFHGTSPDASSVAALALHTKQHCRIEEPLFWTGTSPKSTGYSSGSEVTKDRAKEFDQLSRHDPFSPEVMPASIRGLFDFAVIFYEALLQNPGASRVWSSRLVRNIFLGGLALRNEAFRAQIVKTYEGDLSSFELRFYMRVVKMLAAVWRRKVEPPAADSRRSIYSEDRGTFPSIAHASACVLRLYKEHGGR